MRIRRWWLGAVALTVLATACTPQRSAPPRTPDRPALLVEVHRSASCSCCKRYEAYLRANQVGVRTVIHEDIVTMKHALGISDEMASCHTALVGRYFVEGHVPIEAIRRLFETQPAIDGISLPGMPPEAPGMGGTTTGPLTIFSITDGTVAEFARL